MSARIRILLAALLLLIPMSSARAQVKTPLTVTKLFSTAKPGHWIRLEGVPQADQAVLCTKAKILTGAIKETAWTLKGQVRSVDPAKRQVAIGRHRVRLVEAPKYSSPTNTLHGLSDLKPGMYVKVEGTYGKELGFLATKVDDQSAETAQKPGSERRVLHQGRIERIDPAKKTIAVMGTTYIVNDDTQVTSVVK